MCIERLGFGFVVRRVFLEEGKEIFEIYEIFFDLEVYIFIGENFKDLYKSVKGK